MTAVEGDLLDLENVPIIRLFHPTDIDEVIELNSISFPNPYSIGTFMSLYEQFPEGFIVAEMHTKVIGYAVSRITHSFSFRTFRYEKEGHIVSIAVSPVLRGKKIGSLLLNRMLNYLEKKENVVKIHLEVRIDNTMAQEMYLHKGFVFDKILPTYYRDGTSAYLMVRAVKN